MKKQKHEPFCKPEDGKPFDPDCCGNCRYWKGELGSDDWEDCRINSPGVLRNYTLGKDWVFQDSCGFPVVHGSDWCGKFERGRDGFYVSSRPVGEGWSEI